MIRYHDLRWDSALFLFLVQCSLTVIHTLLCANILCVCRDSNPRVCIYAYAGRPLDFYCSFTISLWLWFDQHGRVPFYGNPGVEA